MFAKKFLSIVALLFIGLQNSKVSAVCEPKSNTGSDCDLTSTSCTTGDDGFYVATDNEILVEVSSEGTICNKVTTTGYYKGKTSGYYYVKSGTYNDFSSEASDDNTAVGEIDTKTTPSLILDGDGNKLAFGGSGNELYLLTDAKKVFTDDAASTVVVKSVGDSIIIDNSINGADVCVSNVGLITTNIRQGFCTNNACAQYKNCANTGVCTDVVYTTSRAEHEPECKPNDSTLKANCEAGYHVMESGSLVNNGDAGTTLYNCNGEDNCSLITNIPTGYLINGNKNNKSTYAYLECNGINCKAIEVGEADNCTGKKAGDLIYSGSVYKICISTSIPVEISYANIGKYFVKHDSTADSSNVFQDNKTDLNSYHFMVEINALETSVSGNGVTFPSTKEGNTVKYRYADDNQKIYEKNDATRLTTICLNSNNMVEYTKDYKDDDTVDYYVQGSTSTKGPLSSN